MKIEGFTLIELLIVIIIIGITATLALVNYGSYNENVLDKEAMASLRLIQAAEKIYRMENQSIYFPDTGEQTSWTTINANLKLDLSALNWAFQADQNGCGQTTRTHNSITRNFRLQISETDPVSGTCP